MSDGEAGFELLWRHVLDHWDEDAAHHAFLQSCQAERRLADAAARYRGMAGDHGRHEIAEKKLQAILVMALAEMESDRTEPPRPRSSSKLVLLIGTMLLSLGLLLLYSRLF